VVLTLLLVTTGIFFHALSGLPGLLSQRSADGGQKLAVLFSIIGSTIGIAGAVVSFWFPEAKTSIIAIDGLSVIFLLPIFLISTLGSIYGLSYWKQSDHPDNGRKLRVFYGLVTAALAAVTVAANTILFLVAWEIMALSAYFLIATEDKDTAVREAGWVYLIATHLATLCLFGLFALLHSATGSFQLTPLTSVAVAPGVITAIFLLGLIGFGFKAGLMPLHMWLPGAHAMAPSHVSALMSGVLIKIGIYGLLRLCSILPDPPLWWGGAILVTGVVSGVLGVVFALGQHDLKRLLAYHSIENIGIITIGIGLAMIGRSLQRPDFVVLGMAGALLHVWNHGLFKSLLFFSAGSVIHAAHTREIDHLGGLAKSMPRTALYFAVGAAAICGLPPLNGFISEFLIYLGLFRSLNSGDGMTWTAAAFAVPALAMIGALAVTCFVKAFGAVFLGVARSDHARHAREATSSMTGPMLALVAFCFFIGLAPLLVAPVLEHGISAWAPDLSHRGLELSLLAPLGWLSIGGGALLVLIILAGLILAKRLQSCGVNSGVTWDCGYAAPAPTMQYTSSSFAQMMVSMFSWVLRPRIETPAEQPLFAGAAHYHSHVSDIVLDGVLRPCFRLGAKITSSFRFLQAGNIHAYLFYIVLFLIGLLLWR
ncbi:MAG: proton-conducting transporter membrane subunit, partial [Candidatus Zixiibacteriota bacterium]